MSSMTDAEKIAASLSEALASFDTVADNCPARRRWLGDEPCPRCKATSSEGCRSEIGAAYAVVDAVRAIIQGETA